MCEITTKKNAVKLLQCQKIFRGRYLRLTFILYYFSETYLITIKFGNWNWATKIVELNYEKMFFVKTHDIKKCLEVGTGV